MQIGFGILLEHEPHNFIRKIQLEFHHELSVLPGRQNPHITFKSPFQVHDIEVYVSYFDQLAKETTPFEIEMKGVGSFGEAILFLDVVETEELRSLHRKVLGDMKERFQIDPDPLEGDQVKFHATIARFQSRDALMEAKEMVEKESPHFKYIAKEFGIFFHLGGSHSWIVYRRIPIGT